MKNRYPLIAVTMPPVDEPTARDTIALLVGVEVSAMCDILDLAADHVARRMVGITDPRHDTPALPYQAIRARLDWHIAETECVAAPCLVSTAAQAIADTIADLGPAMRRAA